MTYAVYGLIDPRDAGVFYVGCTKRSPRVCIESHRGDPSRAAYHRLRELRGEGLDPIWIAFRRFDDRRLALRFERSMIILLDEPLLNRESRRPFMGGVLSVKDAA